MSERVLLARIKEWMSSLNEKTEQKRKRFVVWVSSFLLYKRANELGVQKHTCVRVRLQLLSCASVYRIVSYSVRVSYSNDRCQLLIGAIFASVMGDQNQNLLVIAMRDNDK